jgi:predicted RND superfamily exporter protein
MALAEQLAIESKTFQTPDKLRIAEQLQQYLQSTGYVGKSNGLADVVKTVYRELNGGEEDFYRLPDSSRAIAQTVLSYQSSHRPDDLWHFVTPDYQSTVLWLQLKSGDNLAMTKVIAAVEQYLADNPLPAGMSMEWGGLTYINVVWQEAMVNGMLNSLLGAFVTVFVIMILLFRSVLFGTLAMIPLSLAIGLIYGLIGISGKEYDMPVAVLSALTLGLSVDFAIHFIERARALFRETGSWPATLIALFGEPALAISRNAIVIAVGFLPLLAAPLVPYQTVGFFLAAIMAVSCIATLLLLPAILQLIRRWVFKSGTDHRASATTSV